MINEKLQAFSQIKAMLSIKPTLNKLTTSDIMPDIQNAIKNE